jgi:two-component system, chemotaxis family, protein-glutamate methylesterase/glutaminase
MSKVLIVDDSALMRRLISGVLTEAGFEVVMARNGAEGVQQLIEAQPDVVTLDINMPEMDGLTALSLMMQTRPTPVIMVSSLTEKGTQATFEALALGAVDFIAKPGGTISLSVEDIAVQLVQKVRAAARARLRIARHTGGRSPAPSADMPVQAPASPRQVERLAPRPPGQRPAPKTLAQRPGGLVVIGVSTGGPRTLEDILPYLPAEFPWPILIAQHMPPNFTDAFARRMDRLCRLHVKECNGSMLLEAGHVYVGQGGTDMVVAERMGRLVVQSRPETAGYAWHPSVDVLTESAMKHMPASKVVGVQLTGMGYDGAKTMAELKQQGGRTIAESQETAVVFGMPHELIERNGATVVLPCGDIARQLCHWIS